ncbi:acyl-CoA dehydrogenase, partial [Streptomyces sp. TRM76130]|nr:acyl-CoA dehydrogenase [Streptomyces sp. TRM76130]
MFRLNTPIEFGGYELPVAATVSLVEQLARIDGSTAWNVWNLNAGFAAAFLPEADAERVFADGPDPMIAHSSQPGMLTRADNGFMLSGQWKLVSGVHGAKWLALLTMLLEDGQPRMTETGPDLRFCLVPREAVEVRDTWHSLGMRGTDSNTVAAQNVPVKDALALKLDTKSRIDRPLFRLP